MLNSRQQMFLNKLQGVASNLVKDCDDLALVGQLIVDEFGSGGSNALQDADVAIFGITAYKVGLITSVATQMSLFLTGQAQTSTQNNGQFIREVANQF